MFATGKTKMWGHARTLNANAGRSRESKHGRHSEVADDYKERDTEQVGETFWSGGSQGVLISLECMSQERFMLR